MPSESQQNYVFHLESVTKSWTGSQGFSLTIPELTIRFGEKVALVGYSGCGKSTLLDLLAMILKPTQAQKFTFCPNQEDQIDVTSAWKNKKVNKMARIRMQHLGYILQTGGLLPFLSVRENILLNCRGLGLSTGDVAESITEKLGIKRHLDKYPKQLSVGERQRVAIARAMVHKPSIVIADEPTASLDPIHAEEIMNLFTELVNEFNIALIISTHDWNRVDEHEFRRITFSLEKNQTQGSVEAKVSG